MIKYKIRNVLLLMIAMILLLVSLKVTSEPSTAVTYLMTEETTLFDRGMDKLDSAFDVMDKTSIGQFMTIVEYDWDYNKIIIDSTLSPTSRNAKDRQQAESWCSETIKTMKLVLGVSSPPKLSLHEHSFMNKFFSHYSLTNNKKATDPGKELDRITVMRANISYNDADNNNPYVRCESSLMAKSISVK